MAEVTCVHADDDDKRPNHRALLERAALEGKARCKSGRPAIRSLGGKSGMGAISGESEDGGEGEVYRRCPDHAPKCESL